MNYVDPQLYEPRTTNGLVSNFGIIVVPSQNSPNLVPHIRLTKGILLGRKRSVCGPHTLSRFVERQRGVKRRGKEGEKGGERLRGTGVRGLL